MTTSGALSQSLGTVGLLSVDNVTDLIVTGIGFSPYSLRGVKQQITPIEQSSRLERTVNGRLIDLADPLFRKRKTVITGDDMKFPYLEDVWPGKEVTITSIISLSESGAPIVINGLVKNFDLSYDEYGAAASWTIEVWEI